MAKHDIPTVNLHDAIVGQYIYTSSTLART